MEAQLREIESLLDTEPVALTETTVEKIKKYVKLVVPHVALVAFVCLYALAGSAVFFLLESPNEDQLKVTGRRAIGDMRRNIVDLIREGANGKEQWRGAIEDQLYLFNDRIYKAYKEQYVRYPDVMSHNAYASSSEQIDDDRPRRHNSKMRSERSQKMWTASSALFFAATTMATIGYGNIVPATAYGRIACVIFALIGAPLAIITIGDIGKFLSECTIWLYKQMKKAKVRLRTRWKKLGVLANGNVDDLETGSTGTSSKSQLDWEDLVMDKTEVPVLMVFTILLLYIAFGGVLFSLLEGWSYMDAFYYSFISLTTIGFGDIVPENHDYIVLMLVYLGVGLAVTTMCIDLVGIQYIQKIHYFGRKFRGTDLLQLLKRKRMIERRLAMGQGEEILQLYIEHIQNQLPVDSPWDEPEEEMEDEKPVVEWAIDDALMHSKCSFDFQTAQKVPSPTLLSIRSYRAPSIYSNSSASGRSMMYRRYLSRGGSWEESGPSLSEHCSLSTEPSVHLRQAYWDSYRSPQPSLQSFEFDFPLPSPDYEAIAFSARRARRLRSCPTNSYVPPSTSPVGLACMEDWDSYIQMLEEYNKPYEGEYRSPTPPSSDTSPSTSPIPHASPTYFAPTYLETIDETAEKSSISSSSSTSPTPPPSPKPALDQLLPLMKPTASTSSVTNVHLSPDRPGVYPFSLRLEHPQTSLADVSSVLSAKEQCHFNELSESLPATPTMSPSVPSAGSWSPVTPDYPQTPSVPSASPRSPFSPRTPPFFYCSTPSIPFASPVSSPTTPPDPSPTLSLPAACLECVPEPLAYRIDSEDVLLPSTSEASPIPQDLSAILESSSEDEDNGFDLDLGAFELVDSGMSAETLLSSDEPVIFHQDMPVHSVHHDTVQTEAALQNLMSAPSSMLTNAIPPVMVEDNYCFVVDGEKVRMGDIMGDDQWWRHTSRPTKYFYSEDLRQFHRVNCITAKGRVIAAKLATASLAMMHAASSSSASTPRSSMSSSRARDTKVPLCHVYKVIRFYSFWKSCTSFHRIVTMIDRVANDDRLANPEFKKRLFVQYLWRNAKTNEKARVQKEFDPRRQRLLRFVTDDEPKKRLNKK